MSASLLGEFARTAGLRPVQTRHHEWTREWIVVVGLADRLRVVTLDDDVLMDTPDADMLRVFEGHRDALAKETLLALAADLDRMPFVTADLELVERLSVRLAEVAQRIAGEGRR